MEGIKKQAGHPASPTFIGGVGSTGNRNLPMHPEKGKTGISGIKLACLDQVLTRGAYDFR